jgi:transposase
MANKPKTMEQLIQVFKLSSNGVPIKEISRRLNIARNTVRKYLKLLDGRNYELLSKTELDSLLYEYDSTGFFNQRYLLLKKHFETCSKELSQTGVTRQLLWLEYKEANPDGYNYSQYCYHFQNFLHSKDISMHLEHTPGEEIMIDFAGERPTFIDQETGEVIECQLFIAVLPFSGMIFCFVVPSQKTLYFVRCINEMVVFFGGISKIVICDNFRTAVTRTSKYDPVFTDVCYQLSEHFHNVFQTTRPSKPKDKAMVERSVSIVYNQVMAPLRKETFHSIESLNQAYMARLDVLNNKPYKGQSQSRLSLFNEYERATLISLPAQPFSLKNTSLLTVQRNYHIQLKDNHHYYSVPFTLVGKKVKVLYDDKVVEVYYEHQRVSLHHRTRQYSCYHTLPEHMPSTHQHVSKLRGWTKDDLLHEAQKIGPCTMQALEQVLQSSFYPEQNFKSCQGLLMLEKSFGSKRLEAACARALIGPRVNYTMIKTILQKGLDRQQGLFAEQSIPDHENIRGPVQYQ